MTNRLGIEQTAIITLSIMHLSPFTLEHIEDNAGDISEGPTMAIREQGFLMNTRHDVEGALERDVTAGQYKSLLERFPDLVLVRALARGLGAGWVCFDRDKEPDADLLPVYDDDGSITPPTRDGWAQALSDVGTAYWGNDAVIPSLETLRAIEAGQTPEPDMADNLSMN